MTIWPGTFEQNLHSIFLLGSGSKVNNTKGQDNKSTFNFLFICLVHNEATDTYSPHL